MFQQRIFSRRLPKSFESITVKHEPGQSAHDVNKTLQELKRNMLDIELNRFETKLQECEQLYQRKLNAFELKLPKIIDNDQKHLVNTIMAHTKTYLEHITKAWIRRIRYEESLLRTKLLRDRRNRPLKNEITHVYPQVIIDSSTLSLSHRQLDYLSSNGNLNLFIRISMTSSNRSSSLCNASSFSF